MKAQQIKVVKQNNTITKRVIELHEKGYIMDFHLLGQTKFQCAQDNMDFGFEDLSIKVIDQVFDQFSRSIKYIHTVETPDGLKGVLLCDQVFISPDAATSLYFFHNP